MEVDPQDWIDFDNNELFAMQQQQQTTKASAVEDHDEQSSIPVGSDVDVGPTLTDEEEFSPDLDSECVDDTAALKRMKKLLGHEVSLKTMQRLARYQEKIDEDEASLHATGSTQSERQQRRCSFNSSRSSNLDASHYTNYTAPVDGKKPASRKLTKSKKEKKEKDKKKKKKKSSRRESKGGMDQSNRSKLEDDSDDFAFSSYLPLGDDDDSIIEEAQQPDGSIHASTVARLKEVTAQQESSLVKMLHTGIQEEGK